MKWNDSFAIGIEAIDRQHEKIFEHLLAVENAVSKRDPWHILRFHLAQLREYLKFHFAVEEALLEITRYPEYGNHAGEHERLDQELTKLEEQLQRNGSNEALVGFFERWFVDHVMGCDRKFAAYVSNEFPSLYRKRQP